MRLQHRDEALDVHFYRRRKGWEADVDFRLKGSVEGKRGGGARPCLKVDHDVLVSVAVDELEDFF